MERDDEEGSSRKDEAMEECDLYRKMIEKQRAWGRSMIL